MMKSLAEAWDKNISKTNDRDTAFESWAGNKAAAQNRPAAQTSTEKQRKMHKNGSL